MGRRTPSDFILTTIAIPHLVSQRVIDVFRKSQFSGWTTYAVNLSGADGKPIAGYHGLAITGRCGALDKMKSLPVLKKFPARMSNVYRGLYFEPDTWDGSDFFAPAKGGHIFVTERVRNALQQIKATNVSFTSMDEIEYYLPLGMSL